MLIDRIRMILKIDGRSLYGEKSLMSNLSSNQVQQINSPSLSVLVALFARVGASAFGGSIPTYVLPSCLKRGWLTETQSMEALNWCRSLPGAGGTNLSAYLGYCWQKTEGAVLATLALVLPGSVVILLASRLLLELPQQIVQPALTAVAAASIGILLELTWKLAKSAIVDLARFLVVVITFILVGIFRFPIPLVLIVVVPFAWYVNNKIFRNENNK
jgi:chromate transporter